jgi:hypothetical protein
MVLFTVIFEVLKMQWQRAAINFIYMKKIVQGITAILLCMAAHAQEKQIKQGSTLFYNILPPNGTARYQVQVDAVLPGNISLSWVSESGSSGYFHMYPPATDSAVRGYWEPPVSGTTLEFKDDQLVLLVSKKIWQEIQHGKTTTYDGTIYYVKSMDKIYHMQNGIVHSVYLESTDASSKIWLLNNPGLPVIIKMEGNPRYVDIELVSVD